MNFILSFYVKFFSVLKTIFTKLKIYCKIQITVQASDLRRGQLQLFESEWIELKRFFKLAIVAIWFTAPVISLLIMGSHSLQMDTYPFYGIFSCTYGFLLYSTDAEFVPIVLGLAVFWVTMGVASLLISQYYPMKFVLCTGAAIDMFHALLRSLGGVMLLDAIFIGMVLAVEKRRKSSPASQSGLRFRVQAADEPFD